MKISEETVSIVNRNISLFAALIFPGIFFLEVFFEKGLMSGGINNVYEFILYLIWALIISVPFFYITSFNAMILDTTVDLKKVDEIDIPTIFQGALPLEIILTVITFLISRMFNYFDILPAQIIGISSKYIYIIFALILMIIISPFVSKLYYKSISIFLGVLFKIRLKQKAKK